MTVQRAKQGRATVPHAVTWASGLRCGSAAEADAFAAWRGRPVGRVVDFAARDNWATLAAVSGIVSAWGGTAYAGQLVVSLAMIPNAGGATIALGASGSYDTYFTQAATALSGAGLGSATIRLGWEFNGNWYPWSMGTDPTSWVAYWRRIVTAMRAVAPGLKFDWCVNNQPSSYDATLAWPGATYVDDITVDAYNTSWVTGYTDPQLRWNGIRNATTGLDFWRQYATTQGKPFGIAEWGIWTRTADDHGSGDDPHYIQRMYDWIAANDVEWESYFNRDAGDGTHALYPSHRYPMSAIAYRDRFGNG